MLKTTEVDLPSHHHREKTNMKATNSKRKIQSINMELKKTT